MLSFGYIIDPEHGVAGCAENILGKARLAHDTCISITELSKCRHEQETRTYVDGVLVGPHLASAAAELEKWNEGKRQLKGQYHLQRRNNHQSFFCMIC